MKNKTEYIITYISDVPNYFSCETFIYSGKYDPIWDLKFIYIKLIKEIYEE